jgi:hypothetical protein
MSGLFGLLLPLLLVLFLLGGDLGSILGGGA